MKEQELIAQLEKLKENNKQEIKNDEDEVAYANDTMGGTGESARILAEPEPKEEEEEDDDDNYSSDHDETPLDYKE